MPDRRRLGARALTTTLATLLALVAATPSPVTASPQATASQSCAVPSGTRTFVSGGEQRSYLFVPPPGGATAATPMVVSIHGATGSSAGQQSVSTFTDNAGSVSAQASIQTIGAREGFIAVFPQARESMSRFWDAHPGSDDVAFVTELTEFLHQRRCSSPATTTVNGFSMGAMLTSRLVCARGDLYAGAAMVAGVLPPTSGCRLPLRTPVVVIHGRTDPNVPFDGTLDPYLAALTGERAGADDRLSMAQQWARAKDCPSPGWEQRIGPNSVTDFSCPPSTSLAVVGSTMGHDWNGPGLATSELIWAVMAPEQPCARVTPSPADPAMAAAITSRLATDVAFHATFTRALKRQTQCNPHLAEALRSALRAQVTADPNGPVAQQLRFALTELVRRPPATW